MPATTYMVGDGGGGVWVAGCGWQPGRPCGLGSSPLLPPLLSSGGKAHGAGDESTISMSGSGGAVVGAAAGGGALAQRTCM
jgi:hypothetical protein